MKIPSVPCDEGCADCCCPMPFSKREWALVPMELKKGLDIRMCLNLVGRMMPIPFRPGFLSRFKGELDVEVGPAIRMPLISQGDLGKFMRGFHKEDVPDSCPFCVDHRCIIYEIRPLICRIHGTVRPQPHDIHHRLTCPRGRIPENFLSNHEIDELYMAWMENRRTWQES